MCSAARRPPAPTGCWARGWGPAPCAPWPAASSGVLVGLRGNAVATTPLDEVVGRTKGVDRELLDLAHIMSL